jgi:fatty acid desaturase
MIWATHSVTPVGWRREIETTRSAVPLPARSRSAAIEAARLGYDARMSSSPMAPVTAGDLLTLAELRELRRLSTMRGTGLVLHAWAVIFAAMIVYAAWPSAITLALAVAVIGTRQLGLMVLMHDAAHWRLFPHPGVNNWIAQWLCAHPVWGEFSEYRRQHHLHHRHTRQADDPDLALFTPFPVARWRFWRGVLADLAGVTAVARVLGWPAWREGAPVAWRRLRGPLASNAVLFAVLAALGHWHLYLLLWLLPLATWYQLAVRIRNVAEHALVADDDDPLRNTRTVAAGTLARVFLAPYRVNYHLEHHLFVFAPCWKLPRAHAILLAKGYGPRMERAASYLDVIRRATSTR